MLARAAVDAAVLNVRTNLESVHDAEFARAGLAEADRLSARAEQAHGEIVRNVVA
jgi:formiminotetrahydrofolate cyclodeaminase